jgi:aspartate beta-hydroxylase
MSLKRPMSFPAAPADPLRQAEAALRQGDVRGALARLRQAETAAPGDANIKLQIALALRMAGDFPGALAEIDRALELEPYLLMAHLSKGFLLDKLERSSMAAESYKVALQIAPEESKLPPPIKAQLDKARDYVARETAELEAFIDAALAPLAAGQSEDELERFSLCKDLYLGKKKVYYPEPVQLNFPLLPPYQYYPRKLFPWLQELEAATDDIRAELEVVRREQAQDFGPYIQKAPHEPANQWAELNHSPRWSTYFLWKDGRRNDSHCARCPRTAALLERLPLAHQQGYGPTAMFSSLQPKTRIPAHTGSANTRLIVHLPLVLPGQCWFRVGNETRAWEMGRAWVFDDTIEHEAWNDSDEERVILIFDVWNPFLTETERELVAAMMAARNAHMSRNA